MRPQRASYGRVLRRAGRSGGGAGRSRGALALAPRAGAAARGGGLRGGRGPWRGARDGPGRGARPLPRARARARRPRRGGRGLGGRAARPGIDRRGRRDGAAGPRLLRGRRAARAARHATPPRSPPPERARSTVPRAMGGRADALLRAGGRAGGALAPAARAGGQRTPGAGSPAGRSGCWASASETEALVEPLERLGVRTLGELSTAGARGAQPTASGRPGRSPIGSPAARTRPLRPRAVEERWEEMLSVGDASSGAALERVLGVLVDRLLARPERRGRTLRAVVAVRALCSPAAAGASASSSARRSPIPSASAWRCRVRLLALPAPAAALRLAVERFGPPAGEQGALLDQDRARCAARAARLREAVARCAPWPGRTRRCGPSAWTPTRACPSGGWCSRRSQSDGELRPRL